MAKAAESTVSAAEENKIRRNIRYHSLSALYRKEMADHVNSKRFIIILVLVLAMTIASVYGAVTGITSAIRNAASDPKASFDTTFMFLKLYTMGGSSIPSYMSLIALIGPFIGLILGFDAINAEKNNGTLNRLVSQPIYRDSIIIGKFLASATLIAVMSLPGRDHPCADLSVLHSRVYLLLAGDGHAVFSPYQTCGNFCTCLDRTVAVFRNLHEPACGHHCERRISGQHRIPAGGQFAQQLQPEY